MKYLRLIIFVNGITFFSINYLYAKPRFQAVSELKVAYSVDSEKIVIDWRATSKASKYQIDILSEDNVSLLSVKKNRPNHSVSISQFIEGAKYKAVVKVLGNSQKSASVERRKNFIVNTKVKTPALFSNVKTVNSSGRSGALFLPKNYRLSKLPVMLLFHGSSIDGVRIANIFKDLAKLHRFIIIAPDSVSEIGWEISTDSLTKTEDQLHIENVLNELKALRHINIDATRFIVVGVSAGGALASIYGSQDTQFSSFAVLHGGVFLDELGSNRGPVWLSTGTNDKLRPPNELMFYKNRLDALGFPDVKYTEYLSEHEIIEQGREDLINWWLNKTE